MQITSHLTPPPALAMALSSLPSALTTAALLLLMFSLIATEVPVIDEAHTTFHTVIMEKPKPPETIKDEKLEKPVDPAPTPDWVTPNQTIDPGDSIQTTQFNDPIELGHDDIDINTGGGGIVAYLKPAPIYPNRQLSRGVEGYVDLAFDITASGATTNIRVLESEPQGAFDKAAINALKKWKYKVPVIDGVAMGQVDMMTRITFSIDQG